MKWSFLFAWLWLVSAQAASSDFPIPRLKGLYSYQERFEITNIRRAETIKLTTTGGSQRIKDLRSQGYSCIHKAPETFLCFKNWKPQSAPEGFEAAVRKFMAGIQVEFEGSSSEPRLIHDGSTSQEWEVLEKVKISQTQVPLYHVVRNNKDQIFVSFPVSENQPLSPLNFHDEKTLGMTAVAQAKDTPASTVAYTIEVLLEKSTH